jgi:hypothetical protein
MKSLTLRSEDDSLIPLAKNVFVLKNFYDPTRCFYVSLQKEDRYLYYLQDQPLKKAYKLAKARKLVRQNNPHVLTKLGSAMMKLLQ